MANGADKQLKPAEVEAVLRRAAQLNARGWDRSRSQAPTVSPEVLMHVAAAAGISEEPVRRALWELDSDKTSDPRNLMRKLYGRSRMRVVREIRHSAGKTEEHLQDLIRAEHGLKLRYSNGGISLWDPGDMLGLVRRTLYLSAERVLLKTHSVEMLVEDVERGRCGVTLTADISNQRAEYLSLGALLGVTLATLFLLAGVQSGLFLLGVIPAFAAPVLAFKLVYMRTAAEVRRALDALLDAAEAGPPPEERPQDRGNRQPGQIRGLEPIPRFVPQQKE